MAEQLEVVGGGAPIKIFLSSTVVRVAPDATLREVATALVDHSVGAVVVGRGRDVDGILSERDIVTAVAAGRALDEVRAAEVASTDLVWCDLGATVDVAAERMMEHYVRHVLVGTPGHLAGVVSARDLLGAFAG